MLAFLPASDYRCVHVLRDCDPEVHRFNLAQADLKLLEFAGPDCQWPCTYPYAELPAKGRPHFSQKKYAALVVGVGVAGSSWVIAWVHVGV